MDARSALKIKSKMLPGLRDNEKVLIQTSISGFIYWKAFAILIIAILFLLVAWQLAAFLSLVALISAGFAYVKKSFLLLAVTNQRVLVKSGILLTDMIQLQYSKIEGVESQTTLIGRLFGYTTLMVSGTGSRLAFIPYVENAAAIQTIINEILQQRDLSSTEHMERQARVQAEAIAEALDEHQVEKP